MIKNQTMISQTPDQIEVLVIKVIKEEKPETINQLVSTMYEKYLLPKEEINKALIRLENKGRLHFTKQDPAVPASATISFFSHKPAWYWITIFLSLVTTLTVFIIPANAYPLVYLRIGLGLIFVLFLPGFALIRTFFPVKSPIKTGDENFDVIVRASLSIGLSLALTPMVGLILNYTPFGIGLAPLTLSLLTLTLLLATAAVFRESRLRAMATKPF